TETLEGFDVLYNELKQMDEEGVASQSLVTFRVNALLYWLGAAYRSDNRSELEVAYTASRNLAMDNSEHGSVVGAVGARLLAVSLLRHGLSQRAFSILTESRNEKPEQIWSSLEELLGSSEAQEVRQLLSQYSV